MRLDYLEDLTRECTRFGDVLRDADPSAPVPTCPEWTADDLLWHVAGGAFAFWTAVVQLRDIKAVEALPDPDRPTGHDALLEYWAHSRDQMIEALRGVADDEPIWTWSADHTAGWIKRRMAHETLIHRVDAELTVGNRSDVPAAFASDGVDEILRHFFGSVPEWATWDGGAPAGPIGRVAALDTEGHWAFQLGSLTGTDPDGKHYTAEPALALRGTDEQASFTGSGLRGRPRSVAVEPAGSRWGRRGRRERSSRAVRRDGHRRDLTSELVLRSAQSRYSAASPPPTSPSLGRRASFPPRSVEVVPQDL